MDNDSLKHLDYLQKNIERMSGCSFQIKSWCITVVSAIVAMYVSSIGETLPAGNKYFCFLAMIPTLLFWIMDASYLTTEKKIRAIYKDVAGINQNNPKMIVKYDFPLDKYPEYTVWKSMFSFATCSLYITIIVLLLGVIIIV